MAVYDLFIVTIVYFIKGFMSRFVLRVYTSKESDYEHLEYMVLFKCLHEKLPSLYSK